MPPWKSYFHLYLFSLLLLHYLKYSCKIQCRMPTAIFLACIAIQIPVLNCLFLKYCRKWTFQVALSSVLLFSSYQCFTLHIAWISFWKKKLSSNYLLLRILLGPTLRFPGKYFQFWLLKECKKWISQIVKCHFLNLLLNAFPGLSHH